jgi:predicted CxxxxCH...CXXCH cytochrome family protein
MNCLSRSGLVAVVAPLLILASAAGGCTHSLDSATDDKSDNYHPKGWVSQHGMAFLTEPAFCTNCHRGLDELAGGPAGTAKRAVEAAAGIPDCNSCHAEAWKTNCTFCHGGKDNRTGSPPLGVRKESSKAAVGVGAHSMHVERTANHAAVDCAICHGTRYQSYADTGHLKNGLPSATVSFTGVAGGMSLWEHDGATCSSTYCHGNGLAPGGPVSWNLGETMNCGSCHGFKTSAAKLSGAHAFHIDDEGTGCSSCHSKVVDSADAIANADLHVNGAINVDIAGGSYDVDKKTCTNSCHSGGSPGWDSGGYHPDGWTEPDEHGFAFLNDTSFCKKCHGDDLAGGKSHVSCDKCHNGGKAWRTNCVFCHGGKDNGTGAPPIGVRGETARSATGVGAHTKHAADTDNHAAYNCAVCHGTKPASIDDTGHIDPGVPPATVKFTGISGTSAAWTHSSANCNSLYCHGNGRAPSGQVSWLSTTQLDCSSCHAFKGDPSGLSGKHEKHVKDKGYGCEKCHAADVNASDKITDKKLHVNGVADVSVPGGTWNGTDKTCTNACHIGGSGNWINGDFHPAGWSDKTKHGYSFYQDISNATARISRAGPAAFRATCATPAAGHGGRTACSATAAPTTRRAPPRWACAAKRRGPASR